MVVKANFGAAKISDFEFWMMLAVRPGLLLTEALCRGPNLVDVEVDGM